MENKFDVNQAMDALKGQFAEAEALLKDGDKLEQLLQKAEEALKGIPTVGEKLADRVRAMGYEIPDSHIIGVGAAIGAHVGPDACGFIYVE